MNSMSKLSLGTLTLAVISSFACKAVAAAPQESARALIERAAYAEEHERDFDAALKFYVKALAKAQDLGDAAATKDAIAGRDRVLARQGKATPAQVSPEDEE